MMLTKLRNEINNRLLPPMFLLFLLAKVSDLFGFISGEFNSVFLLVTLSYFYYFIIFVRDYNILIGFNKREIPKRESK